MDEGPLNPDQLEKVRVIILNAVAEMFKVSTPDGNDEIVDVLVVFEGVDMNDGEPFVGQYDTTVGGGPVPFWRQLGMLHYSLQTNRNRVYRKDDYE